MNIEPLEARIAPATFIVNVLTDVTADDDNLTLREAIAAANGTPAADTITFLPTLAGSIDFTAGQIAITETLTILGGGKITLVAVSNARFFTVDHPDTDKDHPFTVNGLRFFGNGWTAPGDGGAISSTEGLRIIGCMFDSDVANGNGGVAALVSSTGGLVVQDSFFNNSSTTAAGQFGGALYADTPKPVSITGSAFIGNGNGGGVFVHTDNPKNTVTVTGSVFAYNDSGLSGSGGGLHIIGELADTAATKVAIADSQFTNNRAGTFGGGLSVDGAVLTLSGLLFADNKAAQHGGGIYAGELRQLTMSKSILAGNSGTNGGGGMFLGAATGDAIGATITGCRFVENDAPTGSGGGLEVNNFSGKLSLSGSHFAGNAGQFAGGLAIDESSESAIALAGNRFVGNVSGNSGGGLAIEVTGALTLKTNYIAGNEAATNGGAVLSSKTKLTLSGNSIVGNRASIGGVGGLLIAGGPGATFSMSGDRILHNETAGNVGGLLIRDDGDMVTPFAGGTIAKNVRISGNIAATGTGGVETGASVKLLAAVTGNLVRDNTLNPQTSGDGFGNAPLPAAPSPAANLIVENLNDSGPGSLRAAIEQANGTPAADKIKFAPDVSGTLTLASPLAVTETLTIYGGGKVVITGSDARRIFTVDAVDNTKDHPFTLDELILRDGRAPSLAENGGAIFASEGVTLVDCIIDSSSAGYGGAIDVNTSLGSLTLRDSHFTGNTAGFDDGAVHATIGKAITISDSTFAGNAGGANGAAALSLGNVSAKLAITGSLFFENEAVGSDAGALALDGAVEGTKFTTASLATTAFVRNTAKFNGGALRVIDGGYALTSVEFIGNTAERSGGGLATGADLQALAVAKSLFAGNTAEGLINPGGGGGVYLGAGAAGHTASFSTTQFLSNDANGQATAGAGLLADATGGKLTVATSLFLGNTTIDLNAPPTSDTSTGGGIATRGTGAASVGVTLIGNLIAGNYGPAGGGGLSLAGDGALTLTKNLLVANGGYNAAGGAMLESLGKITLSGNTIFANAGGDAGGLVLKGGATASFTTAGDRILFNGGLTGGLKIKGDIAGVIAKNVKITGNVGAGMIISGNVTDAGGVMQESTGAVRLLATVLGNLHLLDATRNEAVGTFAP